MIFDLCVDECLRELCTATGNPRVGLPFQSFLPRGPRLSCGVLIMSLPNQYNVPKT